MAVTHLTAVQAFTPLVVAIHLVMLSTAAAFVCSDASRRKFAFAAMLVIGCSATLVLGTFSQLIAQDFGIAALAASSTVLLASPATGSALYRQSALVALFASTLLVAYPELFPFLVLAASTYILLSLARRRAPLRMWLILIGLSAAITIAFANFSLVGALHFMLVEAHYGQTSAFAERFPFYLTPLGFGLGWGLLPYGGSNGSGWLDQTYILAGFLMYVAAVILSVRDAWRLEPLAIISAIMLLLFPELFVVRSAFGLFKLAMFIQPFVLGSLTISLGGMLSHRSIARPFRVAICTIVAIFVMRNVASAYSYGLSSLGRGASLVELPGWTEKHAVSQLIRLQNSTRGSIISDAFNANVAGLEAPYSRPNPLFFYSQFTGPYPLKANFNVTEPLSLALGNAAFRHEMIDDVRAHNRFYYAHAKITGGSWDGRPYFDEFMLDPRLQTASLHDRDTLFMESLNPTLFNHWAAPTQISVSVTLRPLADVHDFLVYVASARGGYPPNSQIWRFENDWFYPSRQMEAVGRYLVFSAIHPSRRVRLEIDYTSSLQSDGINIVPPISVLGATRVRLPAVGHGAARLFSEPLSPQIVGGLPFFELDMGRDGQMFPSRRSGLMALFGTEQNFDYRKLAGFIRDISLVSDDRYRAIHAPEAISHFPEDLQNANLEFSGLYEDGWIADRAKVWLSASKQPHCIFSIRALVPQETAGPKVSLRLAIDGRAVAIRQLQPGEVVIEVPAIGDGRRHEIDVAVTKLFHLPNGDGRPASMLLHFLGYEQSKEGTR
jgi:hypothetical protein